MVLLPPPKRPVVTWTVLAATGLEVDVSADDVGFVRSGAVVFEIGGVPVDAFEAGCWQRVTRKTEAPDGDAA